MKAKMETLEELIRQNIHGTTTVSVDTITDVSMVKKHRETGEPNPFLGLRKVQTKNGLIGFDYINSVNNEADREGLDHREAQPRAWGVLSDDRTFVYHKGMVYLQMKVQSVSNTKYMLGDTEVDYADIEPYLSGSKRSSTQDGLEKEVIVNDIKLENIKAVRMFGAEIEVVA